MYSLANLELFASIDQKQWSKANTWNKKKNQYVMKDETKFK